MPKRGENIDRVDKDAYKREQERIAREREAIEEMAGEPSKVRPPRKKAEKDGE